MYVITIQYIDNENWSVEYPVSYSEDINEAKQILIIISRRLKGKWISVSDLEYKCESNGYRVYLGICKICNLDTELESLEWLFDD